MELESQRIENYLVRTVEVAQAEVDREMLERAPVAARDQASRVLETAVNQLLDFVLRGVYPPELKRLL
jgi:hypothetical protein